MQSRSEWLSIASSTCSRHDCIATRCPGSSARCASRTGKPLERGKPVRRGELADGVHPGIEVERRNPGPCIADLGDAKPDFVAQRFQRVRCHFEPPVERRLSQIG